MKKLSVELGLLWLGTLLAIRGVVVLHEAGVHEVILALVPFLFVYAPVYLCRYRGVDPDGYGLALPAFSDGQAWKEAAIEAGKVIGIIVVLIWFCLRGTVGPNRYGSDPLESLPPG